MNLNTLRKRQFKPEEVCGVYDEPQAKLQKISVSEKDMSAEGDMDVDLAPFHGQLPMSDSFQVKSTDMFGERYNPVNHPPWSRPGDTSPPTSFAVDSIPSAGTEGGTLMQNDLPVDFPPSLNVAEMRIHHAVDSVPSDATGGGTYMQSHGGDHNHSQQLQGILSPYQYEWPGPPRQVSCPQCLSGESGHIVHIMNRTRASREDGNSGCWT